MPRSMPYYGTAAFKDTTIKMFIRKSFLEQSTYAKATIAIAHELSHIVLDSIQHPLRREEKAVDLTAMLLGFGHLYESACYSIERVDLFNNATWARLGYLSPGELRIASRILVPARWCAVNKLKRTARRYKRLLIFVGAFVAWLGVTALYEKWQLHEAVLAEHAQLQKQVPRKINKYVSLVDTRAGFTSLTRIFRLEIPSVDASAFEKSVRKNVCAIKAEHIRSGITYVSEYRNASDNLMARFVIDSCP